jgi:hypothetical protein
MKELKTKINFNCKSMGKVTIQSIIYECFSCVILEHEQCICKKIISSIGDGINGNSPGYGCDPVLSCIPPARFAGCSYEN